METCNEKIMTINSQIEERTNNIHSHVMNQYKLRQNLQCDLESTRKYIKRQIELLIQLINSTKLKVKLLYMIQNVKTTIHKN